MVTFDSEDEREYFHRMIMVGEITRSTMVKIFEKLSTSEVITHDEIIQLQKTAIDELRAEASKLEQEEKQQTQNEDNKKEQQDNTTDS